MIINFNVANVWNSPNNSDRKWLDVLVKMKNEWPKENSLGDWLFETYAIKLVTEPITGGISAIDITEEMLTLVTLKYALHNSED
jgi:hypothetical protein